MKNTKIRRQSDGKPVALVCSMRLVTYVTFHGEFLRLGWVTYDPSSGVIRTFEPLNNTFTCETEAESIAGQIAQAVSMPTVRIDVTKN